MFLFFDKFSNPGDQFFLNYYYKILIYKYIRNFNFNFNFFIKKTSDTDTKAFSFWKKKKSQNCHNIRGIFFWKSSCVDR